MREWCSSPKSKYDTLKEAASQMEWFEHGKHSRSWTKIHNRRRRNSSERNTGATFDDTRLSSMVFERAAMEYYVKHSKDIQWVKATQYQEDDEFESSAH